MLSRLVASQGIDINICRSHLGRFLISRSFAVTTTAVPTPPNRTNSNTKPPPAAATANTATTTATKSKSTGNSSESAAKQEKNNDRIVEYLTGLRAAAEQDQILKLTKLYHLIDLCNKKEHGDYVISGVNFFQHKGQDFNSDIASKLVATSIQYDFPIKVGKLFSKYEHRIGAWVGAAELETFIKKIVDKGKNFPLSGNILITASKKGVKPLKSSFEVVLSGLSSMSDDKAVTIHNNLVEAAKLALNGVEYSAIQSKFPVKVISPPEKAAGGDKPTSAAAATTATKA